MSRFEIFLASGFVLGFWDQLSYPVILFIAISGFVYYRFRETRALTLAQFLEIRYTRNFRLFMGLLAFVGGILNYGVFPAINARFFIYFLDLPLTMHVGSIAVSTFSFIMILYLACTVTLVLIGGQATIMIACCLEGIFSQLIYIVIAVVVLYIVRWHHIVHVMAAQPPGESMLNPFDTGKVRNFNIWFIIMGNFTRVYGTMTSQQARQGFQSAARTAHESRMGNVLGQWRSYAGTLMILVLSICAITYLRDPAFARQAAPIHSAIKSIHSSYLQEQMTVPISLRFLLPEGVKGLFCALMVMGLLSSDGGHLHSWGSILIQDFILPLRKTALSPRQHIWIIRIAIMGVACFAYFFSKYFPQSESIFLWWLLTGSVFTAGAGAAIIGGLYWKKGTAVAAWAAAITGCVLCFFGIILGSFWPKLLPTMRPMFLHIGVHLPDEFWFNYQVSGFIAQCTAATVYVVVSIITSRQNFNLERMLHRGQYAISAEAQKPQRLRERFTLKNVFRFDENFTLGDKIISSGIFWWAMVLAALNLFVAIYTLLYHHLTVSWWANYWLIIAIVVPFGVSLITLVWFTIGGVKDIRSFFVALKSVRHDARDDGRVVAHHNLSDEPGDRTAAAAK
jgi:SSS family solute:Na+ symporter